MKNKTQGHYRGGLLRTTMLERVRQLRAGQTSAEAALWEIIRNHRLCGLKFRRQHQYGSYILDFYCASKRVAVELDGAVHDSHEQQVYDMHRDKYLHDQGIRVLRFRNKDVWERTEDLLKKISQACGYD